MSVAENTGAWLNPMDDRPIPGIERRPGASSAFRRPATRVEGLLLRPEGPPRGSGEAEAQLLMVRRLTELGAAVNAAAHDIHGLLEDIQEHAVGTLDDANGGAPAREAMERVRLAAEAGSALVRRLSRGGPLAQGGPLDLNAAVKAVLDLYMLVVPARVRVVTRLQPGAWPARITQEGLEHILAFLLVQSRDALPAGGTITVATENVTADEPACGVPSPPMAGDHVCLTVSHAGPAGSGPADCGLFEPLVGPCEARDAARFGLSVIAELVRHQGGRLSVGPLPTQGTALKVCLPALRGHET